MECLESVRKAVNYIEEHLYDDISVEDVVNEVGFSKFYFHRVFLSITGCSVSEYIRKRRLTEAARRIIGTRQKILDIGFDMQFNSAEAFNRAFTKHFGVSPSAYRKGGRAFHLFEARRLDIKRLIESTEKKSVEPVIRSICSFRTMGNLFRTHTKDISPHYKEFRKHISEIDNRVPSNKTYGIVLPDIKAAEDDEIEYLACVEVEKISQIRSGLYGYEVPEGNYAVFLHSGPTNDILALYRFIYAIWAPKSGFILAEDMPNIEVYPLDYQDGNDIEIWIGIK